MGNLSTSEGVFPRISVAEAVVSPLLQWVMALEEPEGAHNAVSWRQRCRTKEEKYERSRPLSRKRFNLTETKASCPLGLPWLYNSRRFILTRHYPGIRLILR